MVPTLITLIGVLAVCDGQVISWGRCSSGGGQKVDLQQLSGRWYELARFEYPAEQNAVCVTDEYSTPVNGTAQLLRSAFYKPNVTKTGGKATVSKDGKVLEIQFGSTKAMSYRVLALNPQGFMILHYCESHLFIRKADYVRILSRFPQVGVSLMQYLRKVLSDNSLDPAKLLMDDNNSATCPLACERDRSDGAYTGPVGRVIIQKLKHV